MYDLCQSPNTEAATSAIVEAFSQWTFSTRLAKELQVSGTCHNTVFESLSQLSSKRNKNSGLA